MTEEALNEAASWRARANRMVSDADMRGFPNGRDWLVEIYLTCAEVCEAEAKEGK